MTDVLRVALMGGGKMARQHASAIRCTERAQLVAVADPLIAPSELSTRFGDDVQIWSDPLEMLAAVKPDVVHIVTPPATHAELARAALEAGANVYVEKPFAPTAEEARSILELAASRGLHVCAAHQVLFQDSARSYQAHLPVIGKIMHAESFFSFRPVRRTGGAAGAVSNVEQLIDILPHPVYLLLDALGKSGGERAEITGLDTSIDGEVRAILRRGDTLAYLTVSLRARPVESWLRVMGTNGMVEADFVLGNVVKHPGLGASAPAIVLKPFSRAWQIGWGSFKSLLTLAFRRHSSYPGLAQLIGLFYSSIRERTSPPVNAAEITDTVRVCETIATRLHSDEDAAEKRASAALLALEARLPQLNEGSVVLLTGGTGMLGRSTAQALRMAGWRVRVPVRRTVPHRHQVAGVEYVKADLADDLPNSMFSGVDVVVHLAAETAGAMADHERNTVRALQNLLDGMVRTRTRRLVNVSSLAVLTPSRFGRQLNETSPVDHGNPSRGPYVWAKAEAERLALRFAESGLIEVRTARLGPLVDFDDFAAPGRLGREVGRLFVAMGRPSNGLGVCNISTANNYLTHAVANFETTPLMINLVEVPLMTRGEMARRLREARPDLLLLWLPFWILRLLSTALWTFLKLTRPKEPALDLYSAFKSEKYDDAIARQFTGARK